MSLFSFIFGCLVCFYTIYGFIKFMYRNWTLPTKNEKNYLMKNGYLTGNENASTKFAITNLSVRKIRILKSINNLKNELYVINKDLEEIKNAKVGK